MHGLAARGRIRAAGQHPGSSQLNRPCRRRACRRSASVRVRRGCGRGARRSFAPGEIGVDAARPVFRAGTWCPRGRRAFNCSRRSAGGAAVLPDDGVARWARPSRDSRPRSVSRWLVMPMAAIWPACRPAFASASRAVASCVLQISRGSCSTQPGCGKICRNSRCAMATMAPPASKTMARELDVPWSRASRWVVLFAMGSTPQAVSRGGTNARIVAMPAPAADDAVPEYDVVVVGGGVNGTGIARDLAGRGAKVLLCEKDDLAAHTSSSVDQADPRRPALSRIPRVRAGAKGAGRARDPAEGRAAHSCGRCAS